LTQGIRTTISHGKNDGEYGWCYEYCRDWKIFSEIIRQDKVHIISVQPILKKTL
jgi:hypothetical protein